MKYRIIVICIFFISGLFVSCSKSPKSLGEEIGKIYCDAMSEVAKIVKGNPSADRIRDKIKKLKEETIRELVKIGKIREKLNKKDKLIVNKYIQKGISKVNSRDFIVMRKAVSLHSAKDRKLSNEIASFNTITQYAIFELLKSQNPDEAKRLGIK